MREELNLFKALSDATRLRIMVLLSTKVLCVCQLQWALGLTQAKVSRHLTVLKNAELVESRRDGLWIFYSMSNPRNELERVIRKYLKECLSRKQVLFKRDLANMRKCINKPLEKLCTRR